MGNYSITKYDKSTGFPRKNVAKFRPLGASHLENVGMQKKAGVGQIRQVGEKKAISAKID